MKRRYVLSAMAFCLIILLAFGNSSYAQAVKPIELKLSHYVPTTHTIHVEVFAPFAKELEERTKGRVKVVIYPSEALGKAKDHYDIILRGIADMGPFIQAYTPGRFPLSSLMDLPLQIPSAKVGSRVLMELYEKYLKEEYSGIKVLHFQVTDPGHIHMAKKLVKTLEDLQGLRLRSPGPQQNSIVKALGASPINIPIPELYDSLQRGMVEGTFLPFAGIRDFKLFDLIKYHTLANLYVTPSGFVMNLKTWNSLPSDIQKMIEELIGPQIAEKAGAAFDQKALLAMEDAKKGGAEIYQPPPEQRKIWNDQLRPINEKWVADMEAKGLPGKKIYEDARLLIEKYSK